MLAWGASRINIEEDITKIFPDDPRVEKLSYVFQNARFAEQLVLMVSVKDSSMKAEPDSLIVFAERLKAEIEQKLPQYISGIRGQIDENRLMSLFESIQEHLPVFLDEGDYAHLDSMLQPQAINKALLNNYKQLISPTGVVTKKIIVNDVLGFSYIVLKKLEQIQYDPNFALYDNYVVTRDHRHLLLLIQPVYPSNQTGRNVDFIKALNSIVAESSLQHQTIMASYFGAAAVAVENAVQIRQDIHLTLTIMVILLVVFLFSFFRKKRIPFLIFIPVVFGALFSLTCIYLVQGSVSILAIAAGSIILGIAVNYALHFLVHLKHTNNSQDVVRDLAQPLTLGSATTVLAFLGLQFVNASVLRDLGLFAAFSLIGAAFCSLVFLPHLVREDLFAHQSNGRSWIENVSAKPATIGKPLVLVVFILTIIFAFFAQRVSFNSDLGSLNFMSHDLRAAQQRLENLNKAAFGAVYVVSQAPTLEKALQKNERTSVTLAKLQQLNAIHTYSPVSSFVISDSLQRIRIERWNQFWTSERINNVIRQVREAGKQYQFSEIVFKNFSTLISRPYTTADNGEQSVFREAFFEENIIEKSDKATVITLATVGQGGKKAVYDAVAETSSDAFDRQMLTNIFVAYVHADFNLIVMLTSVMVFVALLISYGRIEIALITFIPMLITWIWILGIMALVGIEFNIVNVMISTFIFGLGDDYSIFTMDGLRQKYQLGRENISSIRSSIFLSALTTITGLGVLIFAEHPALRSIAGISIIGILCVFVMSQTVEPFLFNWLITRRTERGLSPMTLFGIVKSAFMYISFIAGSFVLTVVGLILKLVPIEKKKIRVFYHSLISAFARLLIYMEIGLKKKIINKDPQTFARASVIVSNHSSFLDILLTTMLHPKLILLTNRWVWNSAIFGGVVRLADYYPVMEGVEDSVQQLEDRIREGYSVVVFPEGTRTPDGQITRFHKGAFYIAEVFNIPVRPLLIHGAQEGIPKNTLYINDAYITLKFLPPISPDDTTFGATYPERTKKISRYFKDEFSKLKQEVGTPKSFQYKLINNYLYKGPVLEWYLRIKLRLEKYYAPFHELIPLRANILDLGCGYGFLDYMLYFLSPDRKVMGVDYDEEKIMTAQNAYSRTGDLQFISADISKFPITEYDVIILADVLHYLNTDVQEAIIARCMGSITAGGKIIIREGNADLKKRHWGTQITEFFSVNLLKFNRSVNRLNFISGAQIFKLADKPGFTVSVLDDTKYTSNVIFVINKVAEKA
jgi:1-acyl-sn-glycerol-3-phosphate acyltransferase